MFYTYVHTRNDTGEVFYVGKGKSDRAHVLKRNNPHWTRIVAKCGHKVLITEHFDDEADAFAMERYLIASFRAVGVALCNLTDGGEGLANPTPETRQKIGACHRGKVVTQETRAKISAAATNPSAETRAKLSAASKGRRASESTQAKMSAATKLRMTNPEARAKISAAGKGHAVSAETRAKLSAAATNPSADTRAKMSTSAKGRAVSDETKAKLSIARKNRPPISEETREKLRASTTRLATTPQRRVAASKRAKELWADPVWSSARRAELASRDKTKKDDK